MPQRTDASIADEIRAFGALAPGDAATRRHILAMLRGLASRDLDLDLDLDAAAAEAMVAPAQAPRDESNPVDVSAISLPAAAAAAAPRPEPRPVPRSSSSPRPSPSALPRAALADVTIVERLPSLSAVPAQVAPQLVTPAVAGGAVPLVGLRPASAPILAQRHARAVLKLLAATLDELNSPDLSRLVGHIARGLPVTKVPRRHALTVRRGAQLLIDWSQAMAPLAADREQVRVGLVRLLGADRIETLGFAGCPTRKSGSGARRGWQIGWKPPAPGVPVIVISDVGLAASIFDDDWASAGEWAEFGSLARANGNPVVVLSPFGPERWPTELAHSFVWVPWNELLSAAQLSRIRRDAASRGA